MTSVLMPPWRFTQAARGRIDELETARTRLRPFRMDDLDALAELYSDSETMRFVGGAQSRKQSQRNLQRLVAMHQQQGFGVMATIEKSTGRLLGRCGYLLQNVEGSQETELAYLLRRDAWGNGLGYEVAMALRDHAFTKLSCSRLVSLVDPDNHRSVRLAHKIGLRDEREVLFYGAPARLFALGWADWLRAQECEIPESTDLDPYELN